MCRAGELSPLPRRNIILIGFMATGKTSVGQLLADHLGMEFVDLDHQIEDRAGMCIPEIFSRHGEEFFRRLENDLLREVCSGQGRVVATGGGAAAGDGNLKVMRRCGLVICLRAEPEEILRRVNKQGGRPLLEGPRPEEKIMDLLKKRAPYYRQADLCIDTSDVTVDRVAEMICTCFEAQGRERGREP